ncbi:MAG TPA: NAD(P)H-binding protein, partial [Kineosporiaceae bacterium]|nr:NAD(P)H-binding protein [Kineosporiaceae bacterium]
SRRLLAAGRRVRTLTAHPGPAGEGDRGIDVHPFHFDDREALVASLRGVDTVYNTYWVRYVHGGTSYQQGVRNSRLLIGAAAEAGVRRLVHISITKPDHDSFYPYYRGKAEVEDVVRASGLSYAIVRPTVLFGGNDILVNNIAWLVRHFPVFTVPGDGRYRLRPVATADLADLCVRVAGRRDDVTLDAVGPESFAFEDLVATIARAVGARCRLVHVPASVVSLVLPLLGLLTRDVVLTRDEIDGLMAEYVHTDGEATCPTRLTDYLAERGRQVGARYQSELARRAPNRATVSAGG